MHVRFGIKFVFYHLHLHFMFRNNFSSLLKLRLDHHFLLIFILKTLLFLFIYIRDLFGQTFYLKFELRYLRIFNTLIILHILYLPFKIMVLLPHLSYFLVWFFGVLQLSLEIVDNLHLMLTETLLERWQKTVHFLFTFDCAQTWGPPFIDFVRFKHLFQILDSFLFLLVFL
jgi:hypothetical protein